MSSTQARQKLNSLNQIELREAIGQFCDHPKFFNANPHIPIAERPGMRSRLLKNDWPTYPIFSPYAQTHHGYTQIRVDGIKINTHHVTWRFFNNGPKLENDDLEVSHTLFCGARTSTNVNPRHLIREDGRTNKSRILCHMYMESRLNDHMNVGLGGKNSDRYAQDLTQAIYRDMTMCSRVHRAQTCSLNWYRYFEDFMAPDMLQQYAARVESQAQARHRLEVPETSDPFIGSSVHGSSPPTPA